MKRDTGNRIREEKNKAIEMKIKQLIGSRRMCANWNTSRKTRARSVRPGRTNGRTDEHCVR